MFNRDDKNQNAAETVVGASVLVRGDFEGKGNIIIDGSLEGSLSIEGALFAGEKSNIVANIKAKEAKILGKLKGEIHLDGLLELGPQANIEGDIQVADLSISQGAIINGRVTMTKNLKQAASTSND